MAAHRLTTALARSGALLATAGAVHAAVNARALRVPPTQPVPITERVSLLLPVRDEAHRVGPCLRSLLDQRRVPDLEVLVIDDGSSDGTADVVRAVAGDDPRVRLLSGAPLPAASCAKSGEPTFSELRTTGAASGGEWLGKPWACAQLADAATGSVLVWVDADVVLEPLAIASTVALLREAGLDLVSPYPLQLADGALPRLLQPLLQWSWLTTLPLRVAERSPRPSLAAANGQLLAVDAATYRAAGGHSAVRDRVLDDVALLRAVKAAGGRGGVADGTAIARCRMYASDAEAVDGWTKGLAEASEAYIRHRAIAVPRRP